MVAYSKNIEMEKGLWKLHANFQSKPFSLPNIERATYVPIGIVTEQSFRTPAFWG